MLNLVACNRKGPIPETTAQILLECDADVDIQDGVGNTALCYAKSTITMLLRGETRHARKYQRTRTTRAPRMQEVRDVRSGILIYISYQFLSAHVRL